MLRDVTAFRQGQNLREAFLGLLSHELRTPVTTIYAAANVLGRPASTLTMRHATEILQDMVAESTGSTGWSRTCMVLARFDERSSWCATPSLVQHLIPAVLESERSRWPQVTFVFDERPTLPAVGGDDTSIQQVLRNLLSNAAKYSPLGSTGDRHRQRGATVASPFTCSTRARHRAERGRGALRPVLSLADHLGHGVRRGYRPVCLPPPDRRDGRPDLGTPPRRAWLGVRLLAAAVRGRRGRACMARVPVEVGVALDTHL